MIRKEDRNKKRKKRHLRVRKRLFGTAERPRLNVFRSSNNIYAQLIDDTVGHTIASASTLDKEFQAKGVNGGTVEAARIVGEMIAKRAIDKGHKVVVFDRGGYLYHGRVKALAEGAREGGLDF
ncbi:50S ribosomal protein L18 [Laceyella sacchari]|uniref:Large ribosomal subunit protein uL18 n=3 Tax=Laceyella TaxID=292635 RepID=A0AA45WR77_9BACL|nr:MULTISPECIES: 50S ribosomal protein L18 [Laceyella]KPC77616.1 50S ribosomal protein L18 [Thermoactinomyces vulgaris]AUS07646.1 50S ribosomal protein L18 [Laceyella sacchari]MRG28590.1 50S ribosomal protein L18 [Laceyella tengchongensis]PRZ13341.1 large subunit ribosomal protein L18 [Laceyella sediminis]TCW36695.1 large subunit ribosomal protein L18 [Laceyella sacchari]